MSKIMAINSSYRGDGITDQVVETMAETLRDSGAEVEIVLLREYPIEFCINCCECTQQLGSVPGDCILHDDFRVLIDKIEKSDGSILASPTNFGSVTASYKRFMERLVIYAYWPWKIKSPQYRKANVAKKKAVLVSSCAAPGISGRWLFGTHKQLKTTALTIGADTVGTLFTGLIARDPQQRLSGSVAAKANFLAA